MGVLSLAYQATALLTKHHSHNPKESTDAFILFTVVSALLVLLAGLMSGLTLGLLSLDSVDLEVCRDTCLPVQLASVWHDAAHWAQANV